MQQNLLFILILSFVSCVSQPLRLKKYPFNPITGRRSIIDAPHKDVWRAALQVFGGYSLQLLDEQQGLLVTRPVKLSESPIYSLFDVKDRFKIPSAYGVSYVLKAQLFELNSEKGEKRTEVLIQKSLSLQKHFL